MEASRAGEVIDVSAEEARRVVGEMVPLDAAPGVSGKLGFTLRVPCGIVAAITPFNFPLNLVGHKVGPAIAGGNAVIVKPATDTPLSALKADGDPARSRHAARGDCLCHGTRQRDRAGDRDRQTRA